jgi:flagellar biosynthesis protein FliP
MAVMVVLEILVFGILGVRSHFVLFIIIGSAMLLTIVGMSPLIVRAYRGTSTTPLKSKKKDDDSPRD